MRSSARFLPSLLVAVGGIALPAAHAAATDAAPLSFESPFLSAPSGAGAKGAANAEAATLELHGVMVNQGAMLFNIVNATTKKGQWVALREAGSEYVVKSHEVVDDTDTVMVEHQGRTLRLALVKPKTNSAGKAQAPLPMAAPNPAAPPIAGATPPPPAPNEGPLTPVILNPTSADEARRLEAVAAEVRRRRALRQQASPPTPGTQQP